MMQLANKYKTMSWHKGKNLARGKAVRLRKKHPDSKYFVGKARGRFRVIQMWPG